MVPKILSEATSVANELKHQPNLAAHYNHRVENFYRTLATHYGQLFPAHQAQVDCLARLAGATPARLIDVASGTGEYVVALGRLGYECLGVELDYTMCMQSREFHPEFAHRLFQGDMLELMDEVRGPAMLAFCIGNSLPHLADDREVEVAISQMWDITRPSGKAAFQVVNFDRVLASAEAGRFALSTLKAADQVGNPITLERNYSEISPDSLQFSVRLTTSCGEWQSKRPLQVLTRKRLESALPPGIPVQWYGGFDFRAWDETTPATIAVLGDASK